MTQEKENEFELMRVIKEESFEEIERKLKPSALKYCESNTLVMGMKINFELRRRANQKEPDEKSFHQLADSVENFTSRLLDPLRYNEKMREEFGDCFDEVLKDAIQLNQKKFFAHPVVDTEIKRKWYGRDFMKTEWKKWKVLFVLWCLFDLVFSPILLAVFSLMTRKKKVSYSESDEDTKSDDGENESLKETEAKQYLSVPEIYLISLETPYFTFVRDTLSYIVLLLLHYALCLSRTTVTFSGLEWVVLIFFIGRYLVERKQFGDAFQHLKTQREGRAQSKCIHIRALLMYHRADLWNKLDFISLLVYLVILILRVATFIMSGSAMNNRVLATAGYLYSANTLCLTFRVFGQVLEQSKDVGTIQIALFSILKDISVIIWLFMAAILAFSIAITKVYMVEKSFIADGSDDIVCKKSGISCWWTMITFLGWSLLGASEDFDPMSSADFPSETLARILYAGFLVMGVILLINMLIALLSNTYQRIEENSLKDWSYKSAITTETYDSYDPIPVPFNIIYSIAKLLKLVKKKERRQDMFLDFLFIDLDRQYTAKYGDVLPESDEKKDDLVVEETRGNREMISQILNSTFNYQNAFDRRIMCSAGPEAWNVHPDIRIEGNHLTCGDVTCPKCRGNENHIHWMGARYLTRFTKEFPHFEVAILETGRQSIVIGMVNEGYNTSEMPGRKDGTVGYQSGGEIWDAKNSRRRRQTKGPMVASRGDRIRCTVILEDVKEKEDGKKQVPICFFLNGKRILIKCTKEQEETDRVFMDYDHDVPLYPYIGMTEGCSVLAKMCPRENAEHGISSKEDLTTVIRKVTNIEESLMCIRENVEHEISKNEDLTRKVTKIDESLEETNRKLDLTRSRRNSEELTRKVTKVDQSLEETNRKLELMSSRENAELTRKVTKLEESLEETNRKLDTLLARLTQQE